MDPERPFRHTSPMRLDPNTLSRLAALRISPEHLEETFSRSSGPGGQHVNKVSTACTIRHTPTGLSVTASDSRSQSLNRRLALERLLDLFETQRANRRQQFLADRSKARRQKARRSHRTKQKLVEDKRRRGETKKQRSRIADA